MVLVVQSQASVTGGGNLVWDGVSHPTDETAGRKRQEGENMGTEAPEVDVTVLQQFDDFLDGCSGRVKWASLNSIAHIKKSVQIKDIDPEMAIFRAICAEEEAATALIGSLKEQQYEGAEKLNFRMHADKHAVILFVMTVMQWFQNRKVQAGQNFGRHRVYFDDVKGRRGLRLGIQLGSSNLQVNPTPPLHLISEGARTLAEEFQDEMKDLLGFEKTSEIKKLIEQRANFRNMILYATPTGIPRVAGSIDDFINSQISIINSLLVALALIDPWRSPEYPKSGIVTVSIQVFSNLMARVRK
ncbi:hypothetical protein D3C77_371380 [compost metagenome]